MTSSSGSQPDPVLKSQHGSLIQGLWRASGPLLTFLTFVVAELLTSDDIGFAFITPILIALVAYAALVGGLAAGLISAVITIVYTLFRLPPVGQPSIEWGPDVAQLVAVAVVAPMVAIIVGGLKERNARLRDEALQRERLYSASILASLQDGLTLRNAEGVMLDVNPRFSAMTGFSRDELIGTSPPFPFWPPEELPRVYAAYDRYRQADEVEADLVYQRKSGERFPVIVTTSPIRDPDGRVVGHVSIIKDVTERQRLYEAAQEAVRVRDEFLSIASHELKTPLTSLQLQSQLLQRAIPDGSGTPLAPERLRKLAAINAQQVKRLSRLANDLLDVSRLSQGRLDIQPERVDLSVIAREVVASFAEEASPDASPIQLHADSPVIGRFDPFRIEQVLTNLISNALKYGDGKPVIVSVWDDEQTAYARVQDQGIGIAPEHLPRIFDRFERVASNRYEGLGLGLYIVRQIVEAHHGHIDVTSAPGEGTTLTVQLPKGDS